MKKIFLFTILLFQLTLVFGQCNTTTGTECNMPITYFKCNDGYKPPKGFDWIIPTKIYLIFGNLMDERRNYTDIITYNPYSTASGESLEFINQQTQKNGTGVFRANYSGSNYKYKTFTLCFDCGLGYWATVQLLDDLISSDGKSMPNQGFGYTCAQPTAEKALEVAWIAARKQLGKPAAAFTYTIGTNIKPIREGDYNLEVLYSSYGKSLTDASLMNIGFTRPLLPPDNAIEFVNLIKKKEKFHYNNDPERDVAFGCYFNEQKKRDNNGDYTIEQVYPIFTEKIGGSSNQSGNAQDAGSIKSDAQQSTSGNSNNSSNEANRQNAQNYYNKSVEADKSQAKIKAVGDLTNATINLVSYFSNRKNALRNSLSQEDGQALLEIVNSENPADYTQNIIQIFTDLGYSFRKTDNSYGITTITMNIDPNNINDFLNISITKASYDDYNRISFSNNNNGKLLTQLSALNSNIEGNKKPSIKGIPPSRKNKIEQAQILEKQNKQNGIDILKNLKSETSTKELLQIGDSFRLGKGVEKNTEKAIEFYIRALDLGDNEAIYSLGELYTDDKNYTKAIEWLEKYLLSETKKEQKGSAFFKLGWSNAQLGKFDNAIEFYKKAVDEYKNLLNSAKTSLEKHNVNYKIYIAYSFLADNFMNKDEFDEGLNMLYEGGKYSPFAYVKISQMYKVGYYTRSVYKLKDLKTKKSKDLSNEFGARACVMFKVEVDKYRDDSDLKNQLEKTANSMCQLVNAE